MINYYNRMIFIFFLIACDLINLFMMSESDFFLFSVGVKGLIITNELAVHCIICVDQYLTDCLM